MKNIQFIKSVYNLKDLPEEQLPELVLCGRSNVGKSSFLNSIFNKKGIAKTSSAPGKTRSLNYYKIENKFFIVDLPGFGYAKVSKKEREAWQKLIGKYLTCERNIQMIFHFIDSRHEPTQLDIYLNEFLREIDLPYVIILNKTDKLKQSELAKARKTIVEYFPELIYNENLFFYSSVKGTGKTTIRSRLSKLFL
ncbi:ribosome biogenesis GTP-binding protein YihA/YsxC [Bacteroidota bacterium]